MELVTVSVDFEQHLAIFSHYTGLPVSHIAKAFPDI